MRAAARAASVASQSYGSSSASSPRRNVPHLGRELPADAPGPERHAAARPSGSRSARRAASSVSSDAIRMKPSAASCGNVSPAPYGASVSA